jgi:hypothetical protein
MNAATAAIARPLTVGPAGALRRLFVVAATGAVVLLLADVDAGLDNCGALVRLADDLRFLPTSTSSACSSSSSLSSSSSSLSSLSASANLGVE